MTTTKDALSTRMKEQYENRSRYYLPRRTYSIIRADGKSFHTWTKGFKRPYDESLMSAFDYTALRMCEEIQGAQFAFVQSDEISILLTDFENPTTSAWFDGNIQKSASVSASLATGFFNAWFKNEVRGDHEGYPVAFFDSRIFVIPDAIEVENYFIWRQKDTTSNSISMAAQSVYGHKELHGKSGSDMQEMLFKKGINWNNYPTSFKRGRVCAYENQKWGFPEVPIFTQDKAFLKKLIPLHWANDAVVAHS